MGMKLIRTLFVLLLLISTLLLSSCTTVLSEFVDLFYSIFVDYNTADINVAEISAEKTMSCSYFGYYLSTDNILYSTGANSDGGFYVYYANQRKGIVAVDVRDFDLLTGGGYYITCQNDLYIWNRDKKPELGYSKNRSSQKILEGVIQADLGFNSVLYIDECGKLCIMGTFNEIVYSPDDPYVMAEDAVRFDVPGDLLQLKVLTLIWTEK